MGNRSRKVTRHDESFLGDPSYRPQLGIKEGSTEETAIS